MPGLDKKGPTGNCTSKGRSLGYCVEKKMEEKLQLLGTGMGMRRKSGGGQGMGKRFKSGKI